MTLLLLLAGRAGEDVGLLFVTLEVEGSAEDGEDNGAWARDSMVATPEDQARMGYSML